MWLTLSDSGGGVEPGSGVGSIVVEHNFGV